MKTTMFKDDMLKAVLDLSKIQTRRIIKPQPILQKNEIRQRYFSNLKYIKNGHKEYHHPVISEQGFINEYAKYKIGDSIGVRENFEILEYQSDKIILKYLFDNETTGHALTRDEHEKFNKWKKPIGKKSKLFMFDSMIRNKIKITDIRIERVQDISREDAIAEGIIFIDHGKDEYGQQLAGWMTKEEAEKGHRFCLKNARFAFANLWNSINKKRGYGWEANPWVFVYCF